MVLPQTMPRRDFLATATGLAASAAIGPTSALAQADRSAGIPRNPQTLDLLVRGGQLVDPSQGLNGRYDVGILDGKIAAVAPDLSSSIARQIIDASGRIVTPGLIDSHVHIYEGVSHYGIEADRYHVTRGTTTVVDAGSAGAQTFPGLRKYVIDVQATRIRALLNISATGMVSQLRNELMDIEFANVDQAIRMIEQNRDVIMGVKIRAGTQDSGANDLTALQRAVEAGEAVGLPVMMHIARTVTPLDDLLAVLRRGDLLTHSFRRSGTPENADEGILTGEGILREGAAAALERGVLFDVGHGSGGFSFATMESAMRQGVLPGTISTDLHAYNTDGPVYDLATTISKFLYLGMSLDEAVRRTTVTPASVFGFQEQIGTLQVGAEADVGIFELQEGEHQFVDSTRSVRVGRQKLVPWQTIKGGRVFLPHW